MTKFLTEQINYDPRQHVFLLVFLLVSGRQPLQPVEAEKPLSRMNKLHKIGLVYFVDGAVFICGQKDLRDSMLFRAPLYLKAG